MKIYDISRELFSAPVYPGDPSPSFERLRRMELGDSFNLSGFYTGCHSGTHVDAPLHFLEDGAPIDETGLERYFGPCRVVRAKGILTGQDMEALRLRKGERVLFSGGAFVSLSAAYVLADAEVALVGTDQQSITPMGDEEAPHRELLRHEIALLEGLCLDGIPEGMYTLCAFPLKLRGLEASPVRAVLLQK